MRSRRTRRGSDASFALEMALGSWTIQNPEDPFFVQDKHVFLLVYSVHPRNAVFASFVTFEKFTTGRPLVADLTTISGTNV